MPFSCHLQLSPRLLEKWSLEDHPAATVVHPNRLPTQMLRPVEKKKKRVPWGRKCLFHDTVLGEHQYKTMFIISCKSQLLLKGVALKYSSPSATSHFQHLFSAGLTTLLDHSPQEEVEPDENSSQKRKKKKKGQNLPSSHKMTSADRNKMAPCTRQVWRRIEFVFSCDLRSDFYLGPSKDLGGPP